jgi:branched-subunit amino acid ABC-type transport system permease component
MRLRNNESATPNPAMHRTLGSMSLLDATAYAIGETVAYLAGRVVGRTFHLDPKKAQRIGEFIVTGVIVGVAVFVTIAYS